MNISLRLLGRRRLTEHQLNERLAKKISQKWYVKLVEKFSPEELHQEITRVVIRLKELGHINDDDYAELFIRDIMQYRPHGSMWITTQLMKKGIDASVIANAMQHIREQEDPARKEDMEYRAACTVAEKKLRILERVEPHKRYEKLFRFLCGRGFSASLTFRVLDGLGVTRSYESPSQL